MANRWENSGNSVKLFSWAPESLQMVTASTKLKDTPWKKSCHKPRQHMKKQRHFSDKGPCNQCYCFSSSHVWMWESKSCSGVSNSLWPHGLYSSRNSPGQNTGVGTSPFSRASSQPRDQTQVSHIVGGFFTSWATREVIWDEMWDVRMDVRTGP